MKKRIGTRLMILMIFLLTVGLLAGCGGDDAESRAKEAESRAEEAESRAREAENKAKEAQGGTESESEVGGAIKMGSGAFTEPETSKNDETGASGSASGTNDTQTGSSAAGTGGTQAGSGMTGTNDTQAGSSAVGSNGTSTESSASAGNGTQTAGSGQNQTIAVNPDPTQYRGTFGTLQTFYDTNNTGAKTLTTLVPRGWVTNLSVDWSVMNKVNPAQAMFVMDSPDGQLEIGILSARSFTQMQSVDTSGLTGGVLMAHGDGEVVQAQRETYFNYRRADEFVQYLLQTWGYSTQLVKDRTPGSEEENFLREYAAGQFALMQETFPQMVTTGYSSLEATGYDYSMIDQRYKVTYGSGQTMYVDVISAGDGYASVLHTMTYDTYQTTWDNYYIYLMFGLTEEILDQNRDLYIDIYKNTRFENEFEYLKRKFGDQLNAMVSQNNYSALQEVSAYWAEQQLRSTEAGSFDSGDITNMWSDVIKEQDAYMTEEGNIIKVPTTSAGVWQSGDELYIAGEVNDSPSGWTQLRKQ